MGWTVGGVLGVVLAVAAAVGSHIGLSRLARPRVARHYFPLRRALDDGERLLAQTKDWIKAEFERRQREIESSRENEVKKADETLARRLAEAEARQQRDRQEADLKYPARLAELVQTRDAGLKQADDHYPPRIKAWMRPISKTRSGSRSLIARPGRRPSSNMTTPGTT